MVEVVQDRLRVRIDSRRPSFFGNMLPPGGFRTAVVAEAASVATIPTCLIALDPDDGEVISVEERAVVNAPRCGVRSNDNLEVQTDARLIGADVQAAGIRKGSGPVTPSVLVGAPVVAKWTVAIGRELVVKGAPRLYINDDYEGSAVPLPAKLQSKGAHLVR